MTRPVVLITGMVSRRVLVLDWAVLAFTVVAIGAWLLDGPPTWLTVVTAAAGTVAACELLRHYAVKADQAARIGLMTDYLKAVQPPTIRVGPDGGMFAVNDDGSECRLPCMCEQHGGRYAG
jgi:hypothetical protein